MVSLARHARPGTQARGRFVLHLGAGKAWLARYSRRGRRWVREELLEHEASVPFCPLDEADLVPLARQLVAHLGPVFPEGLSLRLAIPASWAFTRRVELRGVRWSEQAAGFAFEPFVPVELERLAYTVVRTGADCGLVVAVVAVPFRSFFAVLEESGIFVEQMVIDVFGLARGLHNGSETAERGILMLGRDRVALTSSIDRAGLPFDLSAWFTRRTGDRSQAASDITAMVLLSQPADRLLVVDAAADDDSGCVRDELEAAGIVVESISRAKAREVTHDACAQNDDLPDLRGGTLAAPGRWEPLIRRVRRCAWAALLALLALALRLDLQRRDHGRAIEEARPVRDGIYTEAFPDAAVTAAAPLLLRSERIKLEGVTEAAGGPVRLGLVGVEALALLGEVVAQVPTGMKLHLSEIALDDRVLRLAGRTTSHDAAGGLAKSLNEAGSLAADPPQTKLLADGTVQFRIVVRIVRGEDG